MLKTIMIMSFMSMLWWRKSIIMMLLSLELILLTILTMMMINPTNYHFTFMIMMLVIMVSGSTLGLSLLVSMSQTHYSTNPFFIWSMTFDKNMYFIYTTINFFQF